MPTRRLPPTQSGPARPPGKRPRRPAEPRAAVVPPPVRPEPAPGMPGQRWKTRTNPWPSVRGAGARHLPTTSTLPTRPAGRAGAPGPTVIQTCVPSRRAKAVAIHTPAAIPTSGRHLAAVGSMATTGMSRLGRPSTSVGTSRMSRTNPTSPPTSLRGVVAPPGRVKRRQSDTPPDLAGPLPRRGPLGRAESRAAPRTPESITGATPAPGRILGVRRLSPKRRTSRQSSDRISRGRANTNVSWAVVTGCTTS